MSERELTMLVPFLIFGAIGIFGLVGYLLKGFGMFGIAENLGVKNGWLAFIPIASLYLQGELAGEISLGKKTIKNPGLWNLLIPFFVSIVMFPFSMIFAISFLLERAPSHAMRHFFVIFIIGFVLVAIIFKALQYAYIGLIRFKTYQKYTNDALATIHMILGLFIPLYYQIYFFILRNKQPKIQKEQPPMLIAEAAYEDGSTDNEN